MFFEELYGELIGLGVEGEEGAGREDVGAIFTEMKKEDWAFGKGILYLTIPKEMWK